ncbi:MAG: hypothetical protein LUG85_00555 [Clostridiales bacterium]|nr:hypothetical protein [Clostridiales bacterium]
MFFKILRYDIKNGLVKEYKKYLLAAGFFVIVGFTYRLFLAFDDVQTLGNYLLYVHKGMEEYVFGYLNRFDIPVIWICFHMLAYYIVMYYPYNDIDGFGKSILINSKNRKLWFLSKCCWVVFSIVLYFAVFMAVQTVICLIFGDTVSLDVTQAEMYGRIRFTVMDFEGYPTEIPLQLILLPLLVCISVGLVQLTLSLIIKPLYSYIVSAAVLIVSAYYVSPFLIGNYAMVQRSSMFIENGVSTAQGLICCGVVCAASVIAGLIIFNRYDILNKE